VFVGLRVGSGTSTLGVGLDVIFGVFTGLGVGFWVVGVPSVLKLG